eukprot:TRINITY_DN505_c0_g2_i6.p1 TRINITY_DN505_c0_g2~~TRINITY_DN505_c0_g2_i6.p1  ORF type:complete len:435 (-),score=108.48 TRINITY_DN505_c0_g2_i6:42-1346(-)
MPPPFDPFSIPCPSSDPLGSPPPVGPPPGKVTVDFEKYEFGEVDSDSNIRYKEENGEKIIVGATIQKILEKLVVPSDQFNAKSIAAFLLGYRTYISADDLCILLKKLLMKKVTYSSYSKEEDAKMGILLFVKEWVNKFYGDISSCGEKIESLFDVMCSEKVLQTAALQLRNVVHNKDYAASILASAKIFAPNQDTQKLVFWNIPPSDFAQQLTLMEFEVYQRITPIECYGLAWAKKDGEKKSPNIRELSDYFNRFGNWITCEILKFQTPKERKTAIGKFMEIAEELWNLRNFNGVIEVIAGLNSRSIFRMKKSWKAKFEEKCSEYNSYMDSNYKGMRALLSSSKPPCLPYIGMYLTDLTFIDEGNENFVKGTNLINNTKLNMQWNSISNMLAFQHSRFPFPTNPALRSFIASLEPSMTDDQAYETSLTLEPRKS